MAITAIARHADLIFSNSSSQHSALNPNTLLTPGSKFSLTLALASDQLAESAINVTNILAHERGAVPAVVQVFDPTPHAPSALPNALMVSANSLLGPAAAEERRQQLRDKLSNLCGHQVSWPIKILFGTPSTCIVEEARRRASQLVVLGLHTYGRISRLLCSETTLRVTEQVGSAVLAVTSKLQDMPKRVVVAMDFSRASIRAAYLAARFIAPQGAMTLVHVQQPHFPVLSQQESGELPLHRDGLAGAFSDLAQAISELSNVTVTTRCLEGDPATALLTYADRSKTDLIAVGSRRHGFLQKLAIGTVTRKIVQDGRRSVLMVPPIPIPYDAGVT